MPPTPQKITGPSHSSSPTAKARNSVERDKAEAALLKVWPNLGSLDELVPPDVTPPFWGKPLLASLGLLARQKTLREARNLLLDQIDRRKQDVASTRKLLATPSPFLAASDVRAILDRLKSSQVLSDLEPAANSVCTTPRPEPSPVVLSPLFVFLFPAPILLSLRFSCARLHPPANLPRRHRSSWLPTIPLTQHQRKRLLPNRRTLRPKTAA